MKLNAILKAWAVANLGVAAGATDEVFKSAILDALTSNKLTQEKFQELLKDNTKDTAQDLIGKAVANAMAPVADVLKAISDKLAGNGGGTGGGAGGGNNTPAPSGVKLSDEDERLRQTMIKLGFKTTTEGGSSGDDSANPTSVIFKSANGAGNARVKTAAEKYDKSRSDIRFPERTKGGGRHFKAGQLASYCGDQLQTSSRLGKAVSSAYFKWCLASSSDVKDIPRGLRMTDEDRDLVNYALHEMEWSGVVKSRDDGFDWEYKVARRKMTDFERKALLDDSTAGGIEIAPIEFDDALVTTPVLNGEVFPNVNVVDVSRGRRMKGGAVGNPTFASSTEGVAITAFDTTAFVSAFDTTIYVAAAAMEIGMDFEEDSPTNVGQIIMDKYGEKAQEWLDRVCVVGDGTTEPQGVFNASGTVAVSSDLGTSGPATVGDYEGLMFGVQKQYRTTKGERNVFLGNEVSYRRARAIPVGPADERRVFGMTHGDYMLLDHPYKIQNNIANNQIGFVNLGYYRMYRRLGFNVRMETAGNYLATRNLRLIVVRMRYGGKLELGGAAAICSDGQN